MITIIDYGMGNLGSIKNMLNRIGVPSEITNNPENILKARKLILPGVGRFDTAMGIIEKSGLKNLLIEKVLSDGIPILGICLGMQLLTQLSEEGNTLGLGFIPAKTIKFKFKDNHFKIPHMGWNTVHPNASNPLIDNLPREPRFYFVHSYYVKVEDETYSILKTTYGEVEFDSAIHKSNIWGTQFHPEKSHKYGMKLLENFSKI